MTLILVRAVIRAFKLHELHDAAGSTFRGITVAAVTGWRRSSKDPRLWDGPVSMHRVDILTNEAEAPAALLTVEERARTGHLGDGKVWTEPVDCAFRVRTGKSVESDDTGEHLSTIELKLEHSGDAAHSLSKITAIIKPFKLDQVQEELRSAGIMGMSVEETSGFGRQKGHTELYRGAEYVVEFLPKVRIELFIPTDRVVGLLQVVQRSAYTGRIGDGIMWVQPVVSATRIRTGDGGLDAV